MSYRIAGIDVHKKTMAVAVADVAVEGEYRFEYRKVDTSPAQPRSLADWLAERELEEVVMESNAQYWRPVWETLDIVQSSRTFRLGARAMPPSRSSARWRERDLPGIRGFHGGLPVGRVAA